MGGGGELNYVHEDEIWRQQMKTEVEVSAAWHDNWGFLAGRETGPCRGFSTKVAKYAVPGGGTSVKQIRVSDESAEGHAAAESEAATRKAMSSLEWHSKLPAPVVPCDKGGRTLVNESLRGVETREAALLMRSHKLQSLGDACLTDGLDPAQKYRAPMVDSHEYGWRAPTATNGRPSLELFGVAEHGKRGVVTKFT